MRVRMLSLLLLTLGLPLLASADQPGTVLIKNLKVLVPIYRGEGDKRLDDAAVAGILAGAERTRLFYFRNTSGRLNLEVVPMLIEATAPETEGATYDYIERDLSERGVRQGQYDGVFTTGAGLKGNYGGYTIFGDMGAAFGMPDKRGGLTWYPEDDPDVWYGLCWTFVHEFQHALDISICGAWLPEMLHGHPYADCAEPGFRWGIHGAQHFSWEAATLRGLGERVLLIPGARREWWSAADADGDGLADDDPRLPTDEKRLGSDPATADSDSDGLDDLAEFTCDILLGSDPRNADSDADGIADGLDRCPSVAIAESLPYAGETPVADGLRDDAYGPLLSRVLVTNREELRGATVEGCWNEDGLYLLLRGAPASGWMLELDSSFDNGFWEGGDTYEIRATADGKVSFAGLGLSGAVPGATAASGPDGLEVAIPAVIGQGVSNEINWGGVRREEDKTDGLRLLEGRTIGANLAVEGAGGRALFMPNYEMFPTVLAKGPEAPSRPSLRGSPTLTRDAWPEVVVSGVAGGELVEIRQGDQVVGARLGSGRVPLAGGLSEGPNTLIARVGESQSAPWTLTRDSVCMTREPRVSAEGIASLEGEPGSTIDLYAGTGGLPLAQVGTVVLDAEGKGQLALPVGLRGWLGAYAAGTSFGTPAFLRVDPEIAFDYNGGIADPRIPGDWFSIAWSAMLDVPTEGDYAFYLTTDDGSRLYVDGKVVVDHWGHHGAEEKSATMRLTAGPHAVRVLYYEEDGWAAAHLEWSGPGIERTHALPVRALPIDASELTWIARETDRAGNSGGYAFDL